MKKWLRRGLSFTLMLLLLAVLYVGYLLMDYHRIDDWEALEVTHQAEAGLIEPGKRYTALTYNIGFGAYLPDFDFFMDGGTQSWGKSEESVTEAVRQAGQLVGETQADFVLFEEVDFDATRSYHINQRELLDAAFAGYDGHQTVNFDSSYLVVPFHQPHGKNKGGLVTYARFPMKNAQRRQLPIAENPTKLFDLDRAYAVTRFAMADGRDLVVYTVHLTAYSVDSSVRDAQLAMLVEDMRAEVQQGNAAICGGDFNMELRTPEGEEVTTLWATPLERNKLGLCINAWDVAEACKTPQDLRTCRDAGSAYVQGVSDEWTLDGFLVTPNVRVEAIEVLDTGYAWSDHNPVKLIFVIE